MQPDEAPTGGRIGSRRLQGAAGSLVSHAVGLVRIADEQRLKLTDHLVEARHCGGPGRHRVRSAKQAGGKDRRQRYRLDGDRDEAGQRRLGRGRGGGHRRLVAGRELAEELDSSDLDIPTGAGAQQTRIREQIADRMHRPVLRVGHAVELGRAGECKRIRPVLQLRLQAHVARAVESQHGHAHDHHQHERDIGQDYPLGVAPKRPRCRGDILDHACTRASHAYVLIGTPASTFPGHTPTISAASAWRRRPEVAAAQRTHPARLPCRRPHLGHAVPGAPDSAAPRPPCGRRWPGSFGCRRAEASDRSHGSRRSRPWHRPR